MLQDTQTSIINKIHISSLIGIQIYRKIKVTKIFTSMLIIRFVILKILKDLLHNDPMFVHYLGQDNRSRQQIVQNFASLRKLSFPELLKLRKVEVTFRTIQLKAIILSTNIMY